VNCFSGENAMSKTTATAVLGIPLPDANNPDYNTSGPVGQFSAAIKALELALYNNTVYTAAGAIAPANGTAILKAGSAAAMTLAVPVAGAPGAGGNDGEELVIAAADAYAYTVTTPANGINGNKHIATWTAAVGNAIRLKAENGVWLTDDTPLGVALT
jgi:hypothetical protein